MKPIKNISLFAILLMAATPMSAADGLTALLIPRSVITGYCPEIPVYNDSEQTNHFDFTFSRWVYETNFSSFRWKHQNGFLQASALRSSGIEIRGEQPSDDAIGTTDYMNGALTYGRVFTRNQLTLQVAVKVIYERLYYATAFGFAGDITAVYPINSYADVIGSMSNTGQMNNLDNAATPLPARFYAGTHLHFNPVALAVYGAVDRESTPFASATLQWSVIPAVSVYLSGSTLESALQAGFTLESKHLRLGIGMFYLSDKLEMPLMLTAGM